MQIKLTPDQKEKFETIKWLTDPFGSRSSGRTELLAFAYIQHAINYDIWIRIVDHGTNSYGCRQELIGRIKQYASNFTDRELLVRKFGDSYEIKMKESYPNKEKYTKTLENCKNGK